MGMMTDARKSLRRVALAVLVTTGVTAVTVTAACAIPSPELVVGTLSSVSQLFAVVTALLGGGAVAVGAAARPGAKRARRWLAALGLVALVSFAANAWQWHAHDTARTERLSATLLRPAARSPDGRLFDPALKELSLKEQQSHPAGMTTAAVGELLAAGTMQRRDDHVLIDIRETAETEMGSLPGARKLRFPDLDAAKLDLAGKTALLFCHNGNRSGETCTRLAAKGIACRFIVGGLEKWLAEGRHLGGGPRSLADLRALPDFPNNRTLLDTADVRRLLKEDKAILVDVRYPGEFAAGHLPGAVNLPIRQLPTFELNERLDGLPQRPVVVPCYDRRSCFFGEILGLELSRRGRDFRGRYTVPWEFFEPAEQSAHVAELVAAQARGPWRHAADLLAAAVGRLALETGLPAAIVLLALLSRILVLPFSVKAERDQRTARSIDADVTALKRELAHDPVRRARALRTLYRKHGLTPGRNMIALLFLPVMAISVEAISTAAAARDQRFGYLEGLAAPDPYFALPAAFGILAAIYMSASLARHRRHHAVIWLAVAPLLVFAVSLLPAGASLYAAASMALLVIQQWVTGGAAARIMAKLGSIGSWWRRRRLGHPGILTFDDPSALKAAGNKAYRLARLAACGIAVPRGIVLTSAFLDEWSRHDPAERARRLAGVWRSIGTASVAVRSSAQGEDGAGQSFAGVFETVLDVGRDQFEAAVQTVHASFGAGRAGSYGDALAGNILVQPMVQADMSGVLFTEDPSAPGAMLLEFVRGTGDALVSGRVAPLACRFGRLTDAQLTGPPPPFDWGPIAQLARRIEAEFGRPQDIEWAYTRGRFVVLQSRDITASASPVGAAELAEWRRLVATGARTGLDAAVLVQSDMAELLPRPTPLSLSLLEALWAPGGSVDLAARRLGLGYEAEENAPPLYTTVFGRLYADARRERALRLTMSRLSARRLERSARAIERHVRGTVFPEIAARYARDAATDFDRLATRDLMAAFVTARDGFVRRSHVEAEIVNIAARHYMDVARRGADAAGIELTPLFAGRPHGAEMQDIRSALLAPEAWRREALVAAIGHRAVIDYELAQPRHAERPDQLETIARGFLAADWDGAGESAASIRDQLAAPLRAAVTRARRFETLKEDAKHHVLRDLATLRRIVRAIGRRFGLDELVFELTLDEVSGLDMRTAHAMIQVAGLRRAHRHALEAHPSLARELTPRSIERAAIGVLFPSAAPGAVAAGQLAGTRVSGAGFAEGRARVVAADAAEDGREIDGFCDGDIIVARMIPPSWLPYVLRSGGVVTEVGGWLSHMAIVARERGIAMIVGCVGIETIRNGARIRLHPDGRVEAVAEVPELDIRGSLAAE